MGVFFQVIMGRETTLQLIFKIIHMGEFVGAPWYTRCWGTLTIK